MADTFEEHLSVLFNPDRGVHTGERSPNRGWKLMNHTHATSQTLSGHKEMPNSLLILAPSELFVRVQIRNLSSDQALTYSNLSKSICSINHFLLPSRKQEVVFCC